MCICIVSLQSIQWKVQQANQNCCAFKGEFRITLEGKAYAMEKIIGDPCLDMAEFYFRSKRGSQAKTDTLIELTFWNDIILLCSNGTSEQLAET